MILQWGKKLQSSICCMSCLSYVDIQRERCLIGICPNIVGSIYSGYLLLCDKLPLNLNYNYFIMLMNSVGQKFIQDTKEKAGLWSGKVWMVTPKLMPLLRWLKDMLKVLSSVASSDGGFFVARLFTWWLNNDLVKLYGPWRIKGRSYRPHGVMGRVSENFDLCFKATTIVTDTVTVG